MDRGIPGERLPAHGEHVEENLFLTRHLSLDPDGLSFSAPAFDRHPGLPQPKGIDLRSGRKEKGLLCNAEILSRTTSNVREMTLSTAASVGTRERNLLALFGETRWSH